MHLKILGCAAATAVLLCAQAPVKPARTIDFQRQIRPVLAENCFQCHGPDPSSRMAGLRLDRKQDAFAMRKNGAAIVPGNTAASLLCQRIADNAGARRMPPVYSHKSLTHEQAELLLAWIAAGAPWQEHWAFRAPEKPALPAVRNTSWPKTPIDRFVLAKLEANALTPAPAAERRTLIRRVALDATGLPPAPADLEMFLADTSAAAYENMVDRYLASPHFGEHRARFWLDAARYGDTHGIHIDNYRDIWPYRDWVIAAFNRNLSFDRFTIEQLAGDLLPHPTLEQRIATGFHRCATSTNEAGIIEDEYTEIYAKDRADTTAAVWLGLTVGCATCHDHKFDPITQRDFYALGAFFRNTTQKVMDGNVSDPPPVMVVPREQDRPEWERLSARRAAVHESLAQVDPGEAFAKWLERRPTAKLIHPFDEKDSLFVANLAKLGATEADGHTALRFAAAAGGLTVAGAPKFDSEQAFTISVSFFFPKGEQGRVIASQQKSSEKNRGWAIDVDKRLIGFKLAGDGGRSLEVRTSERDRLQPDSWNHLVVSYDGSRRQLGLRLYLNGRAIAIEGRTERTTEIAGEVAVDVPVLLGKSLAGGAIADFRMFNREVDEAEARVLSEWPAIQAALAVPPKQVTAAGRDALRTWYLVKEDNRFRTLAAEQQALDRRLREIARRGAVTLVVEERTGSDPSAHVLYRGAYDQLRERVDAATPGVLPPMAKDLPRNRLGFARWLFTPEHPLTARVTVNRMWQEIFGTGIVKSADDFGSQGEAPSNPELLDWLAVDFREHGWDVKRFYRQVLLSAAYRQSARVTPEKLARDPDNRLISRGPRFRLDGELLRDYALAASGLLSPEVGGPSVKPYQPDGVWEAVAMSVSNTRNYKRDSGEALYRRSLYTFWKRSAPPAAMEIFNAPTRESCTVRRERTDTPLQALVTMNDVQFVEAARMLAERAMQSAARYDERLEFIALRLLARPLSAEERVLVRKAYDGYLAAYAGHPEDAVKLLNQGERRPDPALAAPEFAAMTMLASELMNLDEVLNK